MKNQPTPNPIQPNEWYRRQRWRYPFPGDQSHATQLRRVLAEIKLYPRRDLTQNANLAVMEANYRAALSDIILELDRTDLAAVLHVARLLALVPRTDRDRSRSR